MTFGPSAHVDTPPPLRHADVLNGWSLSWHVPDGYLVAVVGAVGTGKSSLLSGNVNMVKVFHYIYLKITKAWNFLR